MDDLSGSDTTEWDQYDPSAGELDLSDAELTALALAADPDRPVADDAVPLDVFLSQGPGFLSQGPGLLPQWYMPLATIRGGSRWRTVVVLGIVAAFLVIEALGLCSTYGQLVPA